MSEVVQTPIQEPTSQFVGSDAALRSQRRAEAIAAIKGEKAAAAPAPAAAPEPAEAAPEMLQEAQGEPEADEPEETVASIVKAREKANRIRRQAEAQRMEIERERMRLDMERREVEQLRRAREAMAKDPLAGLRELGVDMRDLTERAALEGTPEAQMRELREALEAQKKELDTYRQTQTQREMAAQRSRAEGEFMSLATSEDEFPHLSARAEIHPEAVKAQAYQLQEQYYARTGKVPSLREIAEALDYLAGEEYRRVREREARRGTSEPRTGTSPAAGKPKTSRTLSASRAGERGTTTDTANMSRDQRRDFVAQLWKSGRLGG